MIEEIVSQLRAELVSGPTPSFVGLLQQLKQLDAVEYHKFLPEIMNEAKLYFSRLVENAHRLDDSHYYLGFINAQENNTDTAIGNVEFSGFPAGTDKLTVPIAPFISNFCHHRTPMIR